MTTTFPFGFGAEAQTYLWLLVGTLSVHIVLIGYVLGGTGYLAFTAILTRGSQSGSATIARVRDWLPFFLGLAITAGVAPLLFVQVLYQEQFYTANLLLFVRWLAIVPAIMIGFYALYVAKTQWFAMQSRGVRIAVAVLPMVCFAFVGYSWTENHLLSLDTTSWVAHYSARRLVHSAEGAQWRFLCYVAVAIAACVTIVAWQVGSVSRVVVRRMAALCIACVSIAFVFAALYYRTLAPTTVAAILPMAGPYVVAALIAAGLFAGCWIQIALRGMTRRARLFASVCGGIFAVAMTAVRESLRLAESGERVLSARSPHWTTNGVVVFAVFAGLGVAVVIWCVRATRRELNRVTHVSQ